jgi:heterodisulfide reductase subunit A
MPLNRPNPLKSDGANNSALIIGAGIAGIKAALELAGSGIKVYLCDRKPYLGGALVQLDRWFPDDHCGMCKILPVFDRDRTGQYCLRKGLLHPSIVTLLGYEISGLEGEAGHFSATVTDRGPRVRRELCIGCGLCEKACSEEVTGDVNQWPEHRKAIFLANAMAVPKIYAIDADQCTRCGACIPACPTGAIDLTSEEARVLDVGAVILSTGFDYFDPAAATQYGYGRYSNVITGIDLERRLSGSNRLARPSDGRVPRSAAFLQCIGCRDRKRDYCSAACCMYAIKEAMMIKERHPETDVSIFFMDLRAFGKGYHRYYEHARKSGIKFSRQRVPAVKQDFRTKELLLKTIDASGVISESRFDMAVLSSGQVPSRQFEETCRTLGIERNHWGFAASAAFSTIETSREGVLMCGTASGPRDIADTVVEATAAAGRAMTFLRGRTTTCPTPSLPGDETGTTVVLCHCRSEIGRVIDMEGLAAFCKEQPGVVNVAEVMAKARSLVKMALNRFGGLEGAATPVVEPVVPRALVIGAGLAGLVSARSIAGRGFEVELVEKSGEIGGNAREVLSLLGGEPTAKYLEDLIGAVKTDPRINLRLNTEVTGTAGHIGRFNCTLKGPESGPAAIEVGAIVVATGAVESSPSEYGFGQSVKIITQRELEKRLASGAFEFDSVAMVQCVGSRDSDRPYCSRICCSQALKNALAIKRLNPAATVTIFYRDIMAYGFREEYYTAAREAGVRFVRFEPEKKPRVTLEGGVLQVTATDPVTAKELSLRPDLLALSAAIVPGENEGLASALGVKLNEDGFFKENEAKFQPVDSTRAGVFICGLAGQPLDFREAISQAMAAAQRAASVLALPGLTAGKAVATVNERRCSGCELCIDACPYGARIKNPEKGMVEVIEVLCQGCGACTVACPNGAAVLRELGDRQVFNILDAAF